MHLMVIAHPKIAIPNLIGKLKGKSSYMLRKSFWSQINSKLWGNHFCSPSYCVVSVEGAGLDVVKDYIENQRKLPSEKQINQSKKYRLKTEGLLEPPLKDTRLRKPFVQADCYFCNIICKTRVSVLRRILFLGFNRVFQV